MDKDLLKSFDDYSSQLNELLLKSHEHYDKTLTFISSGGLALSMAFVEKIGGENPIASGYLVASWILLGFTLFISLVSSMHSIYKFNKVQQSWDKVTEAFHIVYNFEEKAKTAPLEELLEIPAKFDEEADKAMVMHQEHNVLVESLNKRASYSTAGSFISLLLGVACLIYFASTNILKPNQNVKSTTTQQSRGTELTPPGKGDQAIPDTESTSGNDTKATQQPKEIKKKASH